MVPAYHQYLARSQYLLRLGLPVSDICYLVPEGAPYIFHAPIGASRDGQAEQPGYRFDACAPETLTANMKVKNGALTLPDGTSYRVLVLPERDTMTLELLTKIAKLVSDGATVIGPRPVKSPSLSNFATVDTAVQKLAAQVWGDCDGVKITQHSYGKGRVVWHKSGVDFSQEGPSALSPAQWIWFNEGRPADAAPVAKRFFKRSFSVENLTDVESAQLYMTADNSVQATLNGKSAGTGKDWHRLWSFDVLSSLKSGENSIAAVADNGKPDDGSMTPNPAGFIANLRLKYRDGRVVDIATDASWQSAKTLDGVYSPALSLGSSTAAPWNLGSSSALQEYGDFDIVQGVLQGMKVPVDFKSDGPIRFIHRRDGDADIYFVANRTDKAVRAMNTFRVGAKVPELLNPVTGGRRDLTQYTAAGDVVSVPLDFEPNQSWFVVFKPGKMAGKGAANFAPVQKVGELTGAWQVSFDPKWRGPAKVTFPTLTDWTTNADEDIRFYSGKAVYKKSFTAPVAAKGGRTYLDLGMVHDIAAVKVNGKDLGTVWCAPWRVDLTSAMKPGVNQVEITVANRWPNRLIGDKALPAGMQVTNTTWNPYQATSQLLPSGLIGPVTLLQGRQ